MANSTPYNIHFSDPVPHIIESNGKKYYMQNATNNGQDIMIVSDWFRSDGIKPGFDKKPELMFKTAGRVRDALNVIEGEAVRQLRMPPDMLAQSGVDAQPTDNKMLYKPLYNGDFMYAKLHRDCSFFNTRREMIKKTDLGYGEYRVVAQVKGLYIGSHNENGALASLHVRILQVQYREVNVACLFEPLVGMLSNHSPHSTPPETPVTNPPVPAQSQPSSSAKKTTRKNAKTPLSQKNAAAAAAAGAVIEPVQQVPTEMLPPDFFNFNI